MQYGADVLYYDASFSSSSSSSGVSSVFRFYFKVLRMVGDVLALRVVRSLWEIRHEYIVRDFSNFSRNLLTVIFATSFNSY